MIVPGSNLYRAAIRVIARQRIKYYKFVSRSVNEIGIDVSIFDDPIDALCSFQPVARSLQRANGLDYEAADVKVYIDANYVGPERDLSGDQLEFKNERYKVQNNTDWFDIDGWKELDVVKINEFYK